MRRRLPASTYRLQITADFDLDAARDILDYLHRLGADWIYLSPLLAAVPGSRHGYNVVDPTRVDPERGGYAALVKLSEAAHAKGMGLLLDIVPNHVGVERPECNPWWWSVLKNGPQSPFARYFDIDWAFDGGRLRIPVLGETLEEAAASGALRVEEGELRYHEHRYPLAEGSADDDADTLTVAGRQHYALLHWARADHDLDYRRFFAVNELAAVRVEDPDVFEAMHGAVLQWIGDGIIDGLRVDHPDGLAEPGRYLERLAARSGGVWTIVEKILEPGEDLPPHWSADGTTGYDALGIIDRVLVDPEGEAPLRRLDENLRGRPTSWSDQMHTGKRLIADTILGSEVARLVRDFRRGAGATISIPNAELVDAAAELLTCFPVYRSYLPYGRHYLDQALAEATHRRPELAAPLGVLASAAGEEGTAFSRRFQQTTGMVMAKGVEDTAFYRTGVLATLTEVGGDPSSFSISPERFHLAQQQRLAALPISMTTLSTHDTKRGEDTRARISALSEVPDEWEAFLRRRRAVRPLGDGPFESLLWQSIVGSWPRDRDALHGYAEKASREAATATSWHHPDAAFESNMHALIDSLFDDPATHADLEGFVARIAPAGYANGLAAKLLQLTAPGVPDVYQGSELWERSLVDPDNRRDVDYASRATLLSRLDAGWLPDVDESAAAKLLVVTRALRLRRDKPGLFRDYRPIPAVGAASSHVLGADRGGVVPLVTRLSLRLAARGGWEDTGVLLRPGAYRDELTGSVFHVAADVPVPAAALFIRYPVALLAREEAL